MAKKKEPDKLALDMIQCKKDGFGCHYGAWKAAQDNPVKIEKEENEIPDGWRVCEWCGKPYKPKTKRPQKYCECACQYEAAKERGRKKHTEYMRQYRAERGVQNGQA